MQATPRISPVRSLLAAAIIAMAAFILWPNLGKMTVPDESTFIYEGLLIGMGKLPYRDFFDFILPGTLYIVAFINALTGGVSLIALRIVALLSLGGCVAITLAIGKHYLSKTSLITLAVILWFLNFPAGMEIQHHLFSSFFGMLATWFLWQATRVDNAAPKIMRAGFFTGLTFLCTQSLGGLLGIALAIFIFLWRRDQLWRFILCAAAPVVLTFGFFATQGALDDLWDATFTWLLEGGYRQTSSSTYLLDGIVKFASIVTSTIMHPSILWKRPDLVLYLPVILALALLPPLGLLWPVDYVVNKLRSKSPLLTKDWSLILLWFAALGFFLATLSYPNTRLVAYHGFIPVLLAVIVLQQLLARTRLSRVLITVGVLYAVGYACIQAGQSWQMLTRPRFVSYGTVEKSLYAPEHYPADYVMAHNQLVSVLHDTCPPGESLFIYNQSPELNLLTDRHNPTRYQLLMHLYNTPAQIDEATRDLALKKPAVIIYNALDKRNFEQDERFSKLRAMDYHLHGIEKIIQLGYQPLAQLGDMWVFKRVR